MCYSRVKLLAGTIRLKVQNSGLVSFFRIESTWDVWGGVSDINLMVQDARFENSIPHENTYNSWLCRTARCN